MTADGFTLRLVARLETVAISLTAEEIRLLGEYWALLARWNAKVNLTALPLEGYPPQSLDRLIVEPLLAVRLMPPAPMKWFDLGSGGGSPAVPMKIAIRSARLVMVESRSRKAAFLRETVRSLDLADAEVLNERFETITEQQRSFADCITVRAVRPDEKLISTARGLLKPSGRMILFQNPESARDVKGFDIIDELRVASSATLIRAFVPRGTND